MAQTYANHINAPLMHFNGSINTTWKGQSVMYY